MADVQYDIVVKWDDTLRDVGYADADSPILAGLAMSAIKMTTGAPNAVPGYWLPSAKVYNIIDKTWYIMDGTTASPSWSLIPSTGSGITQLHDDVIAGPGIGNQSASVVAIQGIVPVSVAIYDALITTVGGGTHESITVAGCLTTDRVYALIAHRGSNNPTLNRGRINIDGTVDLEFSVDPGNNVVVNLMVTRSTGL